MGNLFFITVLLTVVGCLAEDCPPQAELGPCECHTDANNLPALRCQNIAGWEEVYGIFENGLVSHFSSVDIIHSPVLTALPENAFADVTMDALRFMNTGLLSLSKSSFSATTAAGLKTLYIKHNSEFRLLENDVVEDMPLLEAIYCSFNKLKRVVGKQFSSSVPYMDFSHNQINFIGPNHFMNVGSINVVLLSFNQLTAESISNASLTFNGDSQDLYLDLGFNLLSDGVPMSSFQGEVMPKELILSYNNINQLNVTTFKPLIEAMFITHGSEAYILLDGNDFECGCDTQWIIGQEGRELLQEATCQDGRLLSELTEEDFLGC